VAAGATGCAAVAARCNIDMSHSLKIHHYISNLSQTPRLASIKPDRGPWWVAAPADASNFQGVPGTGKYCTGEEAVSRHRMHMAWLRTEQGGHSGKPEAQE
jgi:hypothetical protein